MDIGALVREERMLMKLLLPVMCPVMLLGFEGEGVENSLSA